jgi:multiple sugar transport system substrate-binding protein
MKLTRRDCLKWSAAGLAGMALAACTPKPTPTVAPKTQATQPAVAPTQPPTKAAQPVEITYLVRTDMTPAWLKWDELCVAEFQQQNPNIKVNLVGVPWGEYNAKLLALYAAGTPPEISANYAAGFSTFYVNKAITPLDDFLAADKVDMSQFHAKVLEALTRDGKLWALPLDHQTSHVFYNIQLFEKAGIKPPPTDWSDKSWTTEAMLEVAQKLTSNVQDPLKTVWGMDFTAGQLGTHSWMWGADPFNNKGGPEFTPAYKTGIITEVHYNQPKIAAFFQWLADAIYKLRVAPRPTDSATIQQSAGWPFLSGRVGMITAISYSVNQFLTTKITDWKYGLATYPYGPGGVNTPPLFNDSWMLSAKAKQPQAGWAFLKYLGLGNGAKLYAEFSGCVPAIKSLRPIWFDTIMNKTNIGITRAQLEQVVLGNYDVGFETPGKTLDRFPEWNTAYSQVAGPLWAGEKSVQDTLQALQSAFETKLKAG